MTLARLLPAALLAVALGAPGAAGQVSDLRITLAFENLPPLGPGHYEGWLLVGGTTVSTGKFEVAEAGGLTDLAGRALSSFTARSVDVGQATTFVVSIEPEGDTDSIPGAVKPLAGPLDASKTRAVLGHNVGVPLTALGGVYILATPSDGPATNERSGVWFLERVQGEPRAGLVVPSLGGQDWVYEGWAVLGGVPVSTGRFEGASGADGAAPHSGPLPTPPFPGEDFLFNAPTGLIFPTDLRGATVVISIEPRVDDDPAPFPFKPLVGTVPANAEANTPYTLADATSQMPRGTATFASIGSTATPGPGLALLAVAGAVAAIALGVRRSR